MTQVLAIEWGVNILGWLIAGAIGGWLAGQVTKGSSNSLIVNIVLGIVGALVLGAILNALGLFQDTNTNLIGTTIVAFLGALLVTWLVNTFTGKRTIG